MEKHVASIFTKLGLSPTRATTAASWPSCTAWLVSLRSGVYWGKGILAPVNGNCAGRA